MEDQFRLRQMIGHGAYGRVYQIDNGESGVQLIKYN